LQVDELGAAARSGHQPAAGIARQRHPVLELGVGRVGIVAVVEELVMGRAAGYDQMVEAATLQGFRGALLQGVEMLRVQRSDGALVRTHARSAMWGCRHSTQRPEDAACTRARAVRRPSGVLAARRVDPAAQLLHLLVAHGDEAEADPRLSGRAGLVVPEQVRADFESGPATAIGQGEAQLVQRVGYQRCIRHHEHPGFRDVADVADHHLGHAVGHLGGFAHLASTAAAEFLHACGSPGCATTPLPPIKPRSTLSALCQARSTRLLCSTVTMRACPLATARARLSSDCSPTRWPRWFTNSAWSVMGLNQDRRRRMTSPCWLVTNSNQVPNGSERSTS